MNYRSVFYVIGQIFIVLGLIMALPLMVAVYYTLHGFSEVSYKCYIIPMSILLIFGFLIRGKRQKEIKIYSKEGFVICGIGWILVSFFGALPFVISGAIPDFIDAFFESASGFSTTGASILTKIHSLPKSILFWRSFTHWIGGMGILVFMIAIIPKSRGNSMFIMKAEMPGPKAGKISAKISESARILYIIYFVITIVEILVLFIGGRITGVNIHFYDSVVTAFSTAGTGGFSVLDNSVLGYHSAFVEWVLIIFMFLFGINFNLYFFLLTKRFHSVYMDEEFRAYLIINLSAVLLITLDILKFYKNTADAVRDSFFAVNTVMSTTGFSTADFNLWPTFSKILILMLMFVGSSAGSTGGGMKVSRIALYAKQVNRDFKQMIHPHQVVNVRMNKRVVDGHIMKGVNSYLTAYLITLVASIMFVSLNGFDIVTTSTAVISCFNNVGPGLELVGPAGNYADFSVFSKFVLIFDMLAGRLELYPILLLLSPNTWKKV